MPTTSATLSLVPNSGDGEVLQRRREAVDELRADGRDQRRLRAGDPAHELADARARRRRRRRRPTAPSTPRTAGADGGSAGRSRIRRRLGGDCHADDGTPATATSGTRDPRNGRETLRPRAGSRLDRRRGRTVTSVTAASTPARHRADGARRRRRADGARGRRHLPAARRPRRPRGRRRAEAAERGWPTHRPDLVVLDIMLPGTDGLTILRRLRAEGHIPVILLTARADEVDRVRRPRARRRRLRRQAVLAARAGGAGAQRAAPRDRAAAGAAAPRTSSSTARCASTR